MSLCLSVLGGGEFGRALATATARAGHTVTLVTRTGVPLEGVRTTPDLGCLSEAELVFVCVPSRVIVAVADDLGRTLDGRARLVHVSRGLYGDGLEPLTRVLGERTACRRLGVLAGPLVAGALSEGRPGGAIVGTRFPEVTELVREALGPRAMRVYETDDVVGVEVASACVGVLALALGCVQAIGLGPATLATLATRGIHEASRIGESLGGSRVTFGGLAGMGDLVAVVAGDDRPEVRVGRELVRGVRAQDAAASLGTYVESLGLVARLADHARRADVSAPIHGAVARLVDGSLTPADAVPFLMGQKLGRE